MSDPVPDPAEVAVKLRKDATSQVALIAFLVCGAAGAVIFLGATVVGGWPAAVAVCALAGMGVGMSYLILNRS